jgi:hypothetical protein
MTPDERYEQVLEFLTRDGRYAYPLRDACKAAGISESYGWKLVAANKIVLIRYGPRARRVSAHNIARLIAYGFE